MKSIEHKKNKELKSSYKEQDKSLHNYDNCNNFYLDIGRTSIEVDTPLFKLRHPSIKRFLEFYIQKVIPCESTVRKNSIKPLYNEKIGKIKHKVAENPVYFIINETTDSMNLYVLNILVASLNGVVTKPMLLKTTFLDKTNSLTV